MGHIRFTKRIPLLGGLLKLNVNKGSLSLTAGVPGAHATINTKGQRTLSAGLPGTGLSYRDTRKVTAPKKVQRPVAIKPEAVTAKTPVEAPQEEQFDTVTWRTFPNGAELSLIATKVTPSAYLLYAHDAGETWDFIAAFANPYDADIATAQWAKYLGEGGTLWGWLMSKDNPNNKGAEQQ